MRVEIASVEKLSAPVAERLAAARAREFGSDPMVYAEPQWYVLGFLDAELVSRVAVLARTITVAGAPLPIGGISFIVTEPAYRGRGFAGRLTREAVAFVRDELACDFALLTCKPRLEGLYAGLGWRSVPGPTLFEQPTGRRACGGLTMIIECGARAWPPGEIDLQGLPW
jgi:GNAT superfamily N-acetyltransferase